MTDAVPLAIPQSAGVDSVSKVKPGRLRIIANGQLSEPVSGLPEIKAKGQGGLLDIVLSPQYAQTKEGLHPGLRKGYLRPLPPSKRSIKAISPRPP